jgi:hypothetical protein
MNLTIVVCLLVQVSDVSSLVHNHLVDIMCSAYITEHIMHTMYMPLSSPILHVHAAHGDLLLILPTHAESSM